MESGIALLIVLIAFLSNLLLGIVFISIFDKIGKVFALLHEIRGKFLTVLLLTFWPVTILFNSFFTLKKRCKENK